MSDSRARKDAGDRKKGLKRLEKRFASGRITKASVNNRGYNRFLSLEGETTVTIDRDKITEDADRPRHTPHLPSAVQPD